MNKARRKELGAIMDRIAALAGTISTLHSELESITEDLEAKKDEEQEYLDNMPGSLQQGEKGTEAEAAISSLQDVMDALEGLRDAANEFNAEDLQSKIEDARGAA